MRAFTMTTAIEELKPRLANLPTQDRVELAQFLLHSLDEEADDDAEAAWDIELDRRVNEIRFGKSVGRPADEVLEELRKKYL